MSLSNLRKKWRFCAVFFSVRISQKVFDLSDTTVDTVLSSGSALGTRLKATVNNGVTVIWAFPRFGHPDSQTSVIWASPVTLTLTWIAKIISEGDAHITRVLGTGMPKTRGCPYHYNSGTQSSSCIRLFGKEERTGAEMPPAIFSGIGQFANSPRSIY